MRKGKGAGKRGERMGKGRGGKGEGKGGRGGVRRNKKKMSVCPE